MTIQLFLLATISYLPFLSVLRWRPLFTSSFSLNDWQHTRKG